MNMPVLCPDGCPLTDLAGNTTGTCPHGFVWPPEQADNQKLPPNPDNDPIARLTTAIDQIGAAGRNIAEQVVAFHRTLIAGGLERTEAFQLTAGYQHRLINDVFGTPTSEQIIRVINDAPGDPDEN